MRIKLIFNESKLPFVEVPQDIVNSCVHRMLGEDNKYHDKFSPYAVSSLFGGVIKDGKMSYPNGAYFYISAIDEEIIEKIVMKTIDGVEMLDMKLNSILFEDFNPHNEYDIVRTISPILLVDKNKNITYQDDNFIEVLTQKSRLKLLHNGFTQKQIDTLKIEPFHFEKARLKFPKVHKVVNKSSQVMLVVRGDKNMRKALYEFGFGKSTGSGFGSIEIMR